MHNDNPKTPQRGDTVFVPNGPDEWLGGIVNIITAKGEILVGVKGHHMGAAAVLVPLDGYLKDWCYPGDVGKTSLESEKMVIEP